MLLLIIFFFVAVKRSYAYIDPGTGSYITQLTIGFLVGGGYLVKVYWQKISSIIKSMFNKPPQNEEKKETK